MKIRYNLVYLFLRGNDNYYYMRRMTVPRPKTKMDIVCCYLKLAVVIVVVVVDDDVVDGGDDLLDYSPWQQ